MPYLCRMNANLLVDFICRLNPSDRFKRDLGFELTAKILTVYFTHHLLFFAGYYLKLLSGIWGPLYLRHSNLSTTQIYLGKVSDVEAIRWIDNLHG